MGNSTSGLQNVAESLHGHTNGKLYKWNAGLEEDEKKKKRENGPIHVVGTVRYADRALLSPFGNEKGVACQVSVFKNDGYPQLDAVEYLFTGTEAVHFSVVGHAIEGGRISDVEQSFRFDCDMNKVTFKLKQTHLEQYIAFDKKNRILRSHAESSEWNVLVDRPLANKFWDRHAHNSRKGEMATLRSMLNAPIPVPRLAKERVLKVGDPVAIWGLPVQNADGSVTLVPTDDGRLVVTNSSDVMKSLSYRKPADVDAWIKAHDPKVFPMGEFLKKGALVEEVSDDDDDDAARDDDDGRRGV